MKHYKLYIYIPIFIILIYGCTEKPADNKNQLIIALDGNPTSLHPFYSTDGNSSKVINLAYHGLLKKSYSGKMENDITSKYYYNPKDLSYTFTIKRNIKFSNGKKVTTQKIKDSFDLLKDSKSHYKSIFKHIDKIQVIDDYTIKFYINKINAGLIINFDISIIDTEDKSQYPAGIGPYKIVKHEMNDYVILKYNKEWYGKTPDIKKIIFRVIPDDNTRYLELIKGNIDLAPNCIGADYLKLLKKNDKFNVMIDQGLTYGYLGVNLRNDILKNVNIRKAIAYGIDKEKLISNVYNGLAHPVESVLSPLNWAYNNNLHFYTYNPEKARSIIENEGYKKNADGYYFKLKYHSLNRDVTRRIAELIQYNLMEIGIKIDIMSYEWGTLISDIEKGNYDLFQLAWVGILEPDIYYKLFHSTSLPPKGSNRVFYENMEVDKLIEQGRMTFDIEKRKDKYVKIQKLLNEELPYISLFNKSNWTVIKSNISNFKMNPTGNLDGIIYCVKN